MRDLHPFSLQLGSAKTAEADKTYSTTRDVTLSLATAGQYTCVAEYAQQTSGGDTLTAGSVSSAAAEIVVFGRFCCDFAAVQWVDLVIRSCG